MSTATEDRGARHEGVAEVCGARSFLVLCLEVRRAETRPPNHKRGVDKDDFTPFELREGQRNTARAARESARQRQEVETIGQTEELHALQRSTFCMT